MCLRELLKESTVLIPVGSFILEMRTDKPLFVRTSEGLLQVQKFAVQGTNRAWEYPINLELAFGHVLQDELKEEQAYEQYTTKSFDWTELIAARLGREISEEEFDAIRKSEGYQGSISLDSADRFIRLEATRSS